MRQRPQSCIGCSLHGKGTDFSRPEGKCSLGVAIIAEASGDAEARDELPLRPYAPAGSLLQRTIQRLGYSRDQFVLSNIIRCHPPNNFLVGAPWEYSAIRQCRPNLDKLLSDYRPRAILALGDVALRELTGEAGDARGVGHMSGYILRGPNDIPVCPTYHPAFIRRGRAAYQGFFSRNLQRAVNVAAGKDRQWIWDIGEAQRDGRIRYQTHPSLDEGLSFLRRVQGNSGAVLSYDLETAESASLDEDARDGFSDTRIRLCQFSIGHGSGIALPFEGGYRRIVGDLLQTPNVKCGHNLWLFDNKVLRATSDREGLDLRPRGVIRDTLQMYHHWQPDLPAHLQFACQFIQAKFPWKHLAGTDLEFYGICDVDNGLQLHDFLVTALQRDGIWDGEVSGQQCLGYVGQVEKVRPVLAAMEDRGLPVDDRERLKLDGEFDLAQQELDGELQRRVPTEILGLEPRRGKKGSYDYGYLREPSDTTGLSKRTFTVAGIEESTGEPCGQCVERWCRVVPFNANSWQQLLAYMDARGHKRPKSRKSENEDGSPKDTTEKKELIRLANRHGDDFYLKVIEYRELSKMRGTYVEGFKPHKDGRVRTTFTFDTGTGQLTSRNPNCFSADTEVLTKRGWVLFPDLLPADEVAQWSNDEDLFGRRGLIDFALPLRYVQWSGKGNLRHIHTEEQIDLLVTDDHDCLVRDRKLNKLRKVPATDYPKDGHQLQAGWYVGGELYLSEEQIALICALQADGHILKGSLDAKGRKRGMGGHYTFCFSKERKMDRLRACLLTLNIPFSERPKKPSKLSPHSKPRVFYISRKDVPEWWLNKKFFGPWILDLCRESFDYLAREIWFWDGSHAHFTMYASAEKSNTDWAQIITILSNRRAKIRLYETAEETRRNSWQVDASQENYSGTSNHVNNPFPYDGFVYCVTMPKGTVIVRRNGKVAITGNCQNFPERSRLAKAVKRMIVAPAGQVITKWDYRAFHVLTTGFESECAEWMRLARLDMHSYVAWHFLKLPGADALIGLPDDELSDKLTWFKSDEKRKWVRNNQAKVADLAVGFGQQYRSLYQLNMEYFEGEKQAKQFHDLLRGLFKPVFDWQDRILKKAHEDTYLKSSWGHMRRFYEVFTWDSKKGGWRKGDQAEEAIAYLPANDAHGGMREKLKMLHYGGLASKYGLFNTVHDAFWFCFPRHLLEEHAVEIHPVLTSPWKQLHHATLAPSGLWCGVEASYGTNLAEMETLEVPNAATNYAMAGTTCGSGAECIASTVAGLI